MAAGLTRSPGQCPLGAPAAGGFSGEFADFKRAVGIAYDASRSTTEGLNEMRAAVDYLEKLQQHPQAWQFCVDLVGAPPSAFVPSEIFWACSTLIEKVVHDPSVYEAACEPDKLAFESLLRQWMATVCETVGRDQVYVINKFAQLLVAAFQRSGYPHRWQGFFDDLFKLLGKGEQLINLWLKILLAIDVQIIENLRTGIDSHQRERDTLIKDTMRAASIPQVANTWYHILTLYHETRPDICVQCMRAMGPYFAWIDISLVSNEEWVNMLYHFVNNDAELREGAVLCLTDLCEKKIADHGSKLLLLDALKAADYMPSMVKNILDVHAAQLGFPRVHNDPNQQNGAQVCFDDTTGVLPSVTHLCQVVCLELIDVLSAMLSSLDKGGPPPGSELAATLEKTVSMLNKCLPMVNDLLVCGHAPSSLKITEFTMRKYVEVVRRNPQTLSREHLPQILQLAMRRLEFPYDFDFNATGDEECAVTLLRKQLLVVIKNIASAERDLVLQTLAERVSYMVQQTSQSGAVPWAPCEATLRVLYIFGEELGTEKSALLKQRDTLLFKVISELFHSRVAEVVTHQVVSYAMIDVVERFYHFFQHDEASRRRLLELILGHSGARHSEYRVRSRACTMFSGLVKTLKQALLLLIDPIAHSLRELLSQDTISVSDKCNLYDALGVLIAPTQGSNDAQSHQYLCVVQQPLAQFLAASTQQPSQDKALQVAQHIMYLAYLSKGFSGLLSPTMGKVPEEVGVVWKETAKCVVDCSRCYGSVQIVREKSLLYMHRMIDLLGKGVLEYVMPVMEGVMGHADISDMPKVVRIPTQLLQRLKGDAVEHVQQFFAPLIERVLQVSPIAWLHRPDAMNSEQGREHLEILKAYFGLLIQATQPECIQIFLCNGPTSPFVQTVLDTVSKGCLSTPEMEVAKACFQIMIKFAQAWCASVAGFSDYLATQVIPMTVATLKQPHFRPEDAKSSQVATEIANLYIFLFRSAGSDAFSRALSSAWGDLPQEEILGLLTTLQGGEPKRVRDVLRRWAAAVRAAR
eukprot:TRINITY_DN35799_c0_g1_i1.p1 TRINITY_DN35799_c0_g1~~TRINITY_DN35799_c0_g1_i1.p1  ORF type:complete len:1032 (+),score=418.97 TRINITY_DN35799_c0_g1_i1:259-3354(+)